MVIHHVVVHHVLVVHVHVVHILVVHVHVVHVHVVHVLVVHVHVVHVHVHLVSIRIRCLSDDAAANVSDSTISHRSCNDGVSNNIAQIKHEWILGPSKCCIRRSQRKRLVGDLAFRRRGHTHTHA